MATARSLANMFWVTPTTSSATALIMLTVMSGILLSKEAEISRVANVSTVQFPLMGMSDLCSRKDLASTVFLTSLMVEASLDTRSVVLGNGTLPMFGVPAALLQRSNPIVGLFLPMFLGIEPQHSTSREKGDRGGGVGKLWELGVRVLSDTGYEGMYLLTAKP